MQVVWPNLHLPSKTCIKSFKSHSNACAQEILNKEKKYLQSGLIHVTILPAAWTAHCIRERGEIAMKEKIHPQYGKCIVRCVCGETFETGSTKKELKVDICSKCHPFFTGKQKLVDTGGRVDRFKKRYGME